MRPLTLGTRADLKIDRVALRLIDEMMAVGDPSLEPAASPRCNTVVPPSSISMI